MECPLPLWNSQYFREFLLFGLELKGFGHFKVRSSLNWMRILSIGISGGVKFNQFFTVSGLVLLARLSKGLNLRPFFLFCKSIFSSFFRLLVGLLVAKASSPFTYFWALNSRSIIDCGCSSREDEIWINQPCLEGRQYNLVNALVNF